MSRVPIRLRLTLALALAMALVLATTGAFLYVRLGSSLDESVDEVLEARLVELARVSPRAAPTSTSVVRRGSSTRTSDSRSSSTSRERSSTEPPGR